MDGDELEPEVSVVRTPISDAHGEAAFLLVESLIHGLISRSVLSVADAVEIVEVAAQVRQEMDDASGAAPSQSVDPGALLRTVSDSLKQDMTPESPAGR